MDNLHESRYIQGTLNNEIYFWLDGVVRNGNGGFDIEY